MDGAALAHIFFHSLCEEFMLQRRWPADRFGENPAPHASGMWKPCGRMVVPKIRAGEFFFLKSRRLRYLKALPHNFVHRKCEEAHTRPKAGGNGRHRARCRGSATAAAARVCTSPAGRRLLCRSKAPNETSIAALQLLAVQAYCLRRRA